MAGNKIFLCNREKTRIIKKNSIDSQQSQKRKEGETFGRIRSIQDNSEFLYTTISGSEGFTLTWIARSGGLMS